MRVGHPRHYRWLKGIVAAVLILNLIDAVLTLLWYFLGAAHEANPLMDLLLSHGPIWFVVGKLAIVSLGSGLLWRIRFHPMAVVAIFLVFFAYYFLLLYHLRAAKMLWLGQPVDL